MVFSARRRLRAASRAAAATIAPVDR